jgi:transcriptional regulator with PAS, ATPase and Fis domain
MPSRAAVVVGKRNARKIKGKPKRSKRWIYLSSYEEINMPQSNWFNEFPGAITVCDPEGIILEMNEKSVQSFASDGGRELIGTNLLDCHPEPSRSQVAEMLQTRLKNVYTIEKRGVHKLIYQTPWFENGQYAGFIEMSLEIPVEMPHFIRAG